jgi:hypothetical protein
MLEWLTDNFWLSLYIGLSQLFFLNYAARNRRSLGWLACVFLLIIAPLWPLILVIMVIWKR